MRPHLSPLKFRMEENILWTQHWTATRDRKLSYFWKSLARRTLLRKSWPRLYGTALLLLLKAMHRVLPGSQHLPSARTYSLAGRPVCRSCRQQSRRFFQAKPQICGIARHRRGPLTIALVSGGVALLLLPETLMKCKRIYRRRPPAQQSPRCPCLRWRGGRSTPRRLRADSWAGSASGCSCRCRWFRPSSCSFPSPSRPRLVHYISSACGC